MREKERAYEEGGMQRDTEMKIDGGKGGGGRNEGGSQRARWEGQKY